MACVQEGVRWRRLPFSLVRADNFFYVILIRDSNDDLASQPRTKKCAKAVGLDIDKITACATGSRAEALQLAAATAFEKRFPTHAHTGIFEVCVCSSDQ